MRKRLFAVLAALTLMVYVGACDKPETVTQAQNEIHRDEFYTPDNIHRGKKWVDENGILLATSWAIDNQAEFRYAQLHFAAGDTFTMSGDVPYYFIDNTGEGNGCFLSEIVVKRVSCNNCVIYPDSLPVAGGWRNVDASNCRFYNVEWTAASGMDANDHRLRLRDKDADLIPSIVLKDCRFQFDYSGQTEGWTIEVIFENIASAGLVAVFDNVIWIGDADGSQGGLIVKDFNSSFVTPTVTLKNCGWLDQGSDCDLGIFIDGGTVQIALDDTWKLRPSGGATTKVYGFEPPGTITNPELVGVGGAECKASVRYKINWGSYPDNPAMTATYIKYGDNSCTTQKSAPVDGNGWHNASFLAVYPDCDFKWQPRFVLCDGYLYTQHAVNGTCYIEQAGVSWSCGVCPPQ